MFSRNNSLTVDTMLTKRHLNCPITIINSYHCSFCTKAKKSINRQRAQRFSISHPKRIIIKTTPKSKNRLEILRKNNELQRKQKNRFKNKIDIMRKNMDELQEKLKSTTQYSIEQKMNDINCPEYQKTIIKEIFGAAKVIYLNYYTK